MGAVYLAEDRLAKGTFVAIKVVHSQFIRRKDLAQRFSREVEVMRSVPPHENLVSLVAAETVDQHALLIMEYVPGLDFDQLVSTSPTGRLPWRQAVDLILQVLAGLEHAWRTKGLVHRDIKPANLMVTPASVVKILDFGLAKFRNEESQDQLTVTSMAAGTPAYCAPEQDRSFRDADWKADLYSVGCTLYKLITGVTVFGEATGHTNPFEVRLAHHQQAPRSLSEFVEDLPDELNSVIMRLLAKEPAQRYHSHREAAEALLPYASAKSPSPVDRSPSTAPLWSRPQTGRSSSERPPLQMRWTIAVISIVALVLLLTVWIKIRFAPGVLEITVADPNVSILIDDRPVARSEIRLQRDGAGYLLQVSVPTGERVVAIFRGGREADRQRVRVQRGAPTRLAIAPPEPPASEPGPSAQAATSITSAPSNRANASAATDRQATVVIGSGRWAVEDDHLCHYDGKGEQWLLFGDQQWTDYDFSFDVRHDGFPCGVSALFRSSRDDQITLFSFGWIDFSTAQVRYRSGDKLFERLEGPDGFYYKKLDWRVYPDRWYSVRVVVRGEQATCSVDGQEIFDVTRTPYAHGRVGLRLWRTWRGKSEFRKLSVLSPDGAVLWEGPPTLPPQADQP